MRRTRLIVPAAGKGSRFGGLTPKTLTLVNGKPILTHILDALEPLVDEVAIVVSPTHAEIMDAYFEQRNVSKEKIAFQPHPVGMANAVMHGMSVWGNHRGTDYIIVWGDQATVSAKTVSDTLAKHRELLERKIFATIPVCERSNPYVNIEGGSTHLHVYERREGDLMTAIGLSDIGVFIFDGVALAMFLSLLSFLTRDESTHVFTRLDRSKSVTNEFNFLPIIELMSIFSMVALYPTGSMIETIGINTPEDVEEVERMTVCTS